MYDRVGLYRGKKSLCCVNNSKRHLTKRFMGQAGGHQAVHGSGVLEQRHPNADGVPDHEQPPEAAEVRSKQEHTRHRRFRLRQDKVFCKAKSDADAQLLCGH